MNTLTFNESRAIVGVRSRHWTQAAAQRCAHRANAARAIPVVSYRAVKAGWRWHVIAIQNFARRG